MTLSNLFGALIMPHVIQSASELLFRTVNEEVHSDQNRVVVVAFGVLGDQIFDLVDWQNHWALNLLRRQ